MLLLGGNTDNLRKMNTFTHFHPIILLFKKYDFSACYVPESALDILNTVIFLVLAGVCVVVDTVLGFLMATIQGVGTMR